MFAFTILCFSFFLSLVQASPLSMRDVFNPHITSPDANSVWPVGTKQTVTWDTADLPPDSQLTSPSGMVVLGHLGPTGGLNLQLEKPLAKGFKLRDGKVQITVPDVPPRDDYIIVLFGDSGNTSPVFVITRITGGSSSSPAGTTSSTTAPVSNPGPSKDITTSDSSSTLITAPIPITGSVITGGVSDTTTPAVTTVPATTPPAPTSTASTTGTSLGSNNAAWSSHHFGLTKVCITGFASLILALAI